MVSFFLQRQSQQLNYRELRSSSLQDFPGDCPLLGGFLRLIVIIILKRRKVPAPDDDYPYLSYYPLKGLRMSCNHHCHPDHAHRPLPLWTLGKECQPPSHSTARSRKSGLSWEKFIKFKCVVRWHVISSIDCPLLPPEHHQFVTVKRSSARDSEL